MIERVLCAIDLTGYSVIAVAEREQCYHVQVEIEKQPTHCLHCKCSGIVKFGRQNGTIIDVPVFGKQTYIVVNRRRYRCKHCGRTFLETVPHKDEKRQMTTRLITYIERESLQRAFSNVANDVGVDEKTIRNVFNDYCERVGSLPARRHR